MRIVVLGAGGGVGRQAVLAGVREGHQVVAAARTAPPAVAGTVPVAVDVRDQAALRRALEGADVVLWCVGVTRQSGPDVGRTAMPHLVRAAADAGVGRVVTVSGAGVDLPGDDKGPGARLASGLTRRLAGDLVTDKRGEHDELARSDLDWTELRPPRLGDGEASGYVLTDQAPGLLSKPVARADVAAAMLALAASREWVRRSPFLVASR